MQQTALSKQALYATLSTLNTNVGMHSLCKYFYFLHTLIDFYEMPSTNQ